MALYSLLRSCLAAAFACAFAPGLTAYAADPYPARPIRMVVPYAAGGNTDVLARLISQKLSTPLGQQVISDNRPGGNTLIGTDAVAKAAPDGYTILLTTLTFAVVPSLYAKLPYDPVRDFTPITLAVTLPNVLVINPATPANTLKEFIDYARDNPGKLNYASTGNGTSPHLSMEMFKAMAGISMTHVPYKGGAPAMRDLLGGQVQSQFIGLPVALSMITAGKLRALGVTSKARVAAAPNLPTLGETLPGFEIDPWFGVFGPANLPRDIVLRLQGEIARVLRSPEVKDQLASLGAEPVGSTPEQFAAHLQSEMARYAKIVKDANIKAD